MNKILLSIVFIAFLFNPSFAEETEQRINIAVAEFEARNVSNMDAATVSDFVRTELVKSRLFKVLDRNNMAMILEEQQFQLSGCTTQECAVKMGKLLNVHNVVIGNLTKLADVYYITVSVIDIETGEIAHSERMEAPTAQDIVSSSEELGRVLASLISGQEVRITSSVSAKQDRILISKIDTEKNEATINRGALDEVLKRNIYSIYDATDVIAKLVITKAGPEEAVGVIKKKKADVRLKMPVLYKMRKKIGDLGFMAGSAGGESLQGFGLSFYYDYIGFNDWGIQLNMGGWTGSIEGDLSGFAEKFSVSATYIIPVIIKKYFFNMSPISPYLGAGSCLAIYSYEEFYESWLGTKIVSYEENDTGVGLILNGGINIFNLSRVRITLDLKFLFGKEYMGYKSGLSSFTAGTALTW